MPLSMGDKLGHYEVLSLLGEGGMGEVYRARDTRLQRDVALKVLPAAFLCDPERMARFQREAQVLASLDHPNIGHIHGIVDSEDARGLVLALIEGPTLADRIQAGPLPYEEAIAVAKQIIEALEYAHDRGVIHRDLKPANIKITPEGVVKVLDFGLAKVLEDEPPVSPLTNSPTLTLGHTRAGVILGTAAYMSPEQAVGRPVDRRSDVFSFGAVLYEMLSGQHAFTGTTTPDVLEAVVKNDPDWTKLPPTSPHNLLRRCLVKDRKQRLQAIGEARIALENPDTVQPGPASAPSRSRFAWVAWGVAGLAVVCALLLVFLYLRELQKPERTLRYSIAVSESSPIHSFAISPDGRQVAIAATVNGKRQLWLRSLDALQAQPMAGTDDATYPFWSPDSRYLGFFAQGKLKKITATGGPVEQICEALDGGGGSWNQQNIIIFTPYVNIAAPIKRVYAANGAVPVEVGGTKGRFPKFLPDGRHFLYQGNQGSADQGGVYLSSLDGKENRRILPDASRVEYAAGWLLFIRQNTLMAEPFNAANGQTEGDAVSLVEGTSQVSLSDTGVLLYQGRAAASVNQLAWFDRGGKRLGTIGSPGRVANPAISPDGKLIVFTRGSGSGSDLWIADSRGAEQRVTTDASTNNGPSWSPQGNAIVFESNRRDGVFNLYQKAVGAKREELLLPSNRNNNPSQWSPDGRFIVYFEADPKTKRDIWVLPMTGSERKPSPFLQSEFNELFGQLSPDSHWMAYTSDESGVREVYVRMFPSGETPMKISLAGGEQPRWSRAGNELFFVAADGRMMVVSVKAVTGAKPSLEPGTPQALFETHFSRGSSTGVMFQYDVAPDGKRFLVETVAGPESVPALNAVVNWQAGLKK